MRQSPPRDEAAARVTVRREFALLGVPTYRLEDQATGIDTADLLIADHPRYYFIELKVDAPTSEGQREWLQVKWQRCRNSYLLRYDRRTRHWRLWPGAASRLLVPGLELWSNRDFEAERVLQLIEESSYGKSDRATGSTGIGSRRTARRPCP